MRLRDKCLGIDFREQKINLVLLKKLAKKIEIIKFGTVDIDKGLTEEEIAERISGKLGELKIKVKKAVLGIPRKDVMVQRIKFPFLGEGDVRQIIDYELDKHLPCNPADVYFDFLLKEHIEASSRDILLFAVKKEELERYYRILSLAGIPTAVFDVSILANYNLFCLKNNIHDDMEGTLIPFLDISRNGFDITIADKGLLLSTFHFRHDEKEWEEYFFDGTEKQGTKECRSIFKGIEQSIYSLKEGKISQRFDKLVYCGTATPEFVLRKLSEAKPEFKTEYLGDGIGNIVSCSQNFDINSYSSALALAIRGFDKGHSLINLLPEEKRAKNGNPGFVSALVLAGLSLVLFLAIVISNALIERKNLKNLNQEIASLDPEVQKVEKMSEEAQKLGKQLTEFNKIVSDKRPILDLVQDLSKLVPKECWLTRLEISKDNKILLSGYAKEMKNVADLKIELNKSKFLENIEETSQSSMRKDAAYFRLGVDFAKGKEPESTPAAKKPETSEATPEKSLENQDKPGSKSEVETSEKLNELKEIMGAKTGKDNTEMLENIKKIKERMEQKSGRSKEKDKALGEKKELPELPSGETQ